MLIPTKFLLSLYFSMLRCVCGRCWFLWRRRKKKDYLDRGSPYLVYCSMLRIKPELQ